MVVTLNGAEVSRLEELTPQRVLAVNLSQAPARGEHPRDHGHRGRWNAHQEVRTLHYEKHVPLTVDFRYL